MGRALAPALLLALAIPTIAQAASRPAVEAEHAMVVSEQKYATEAGLKVLQDGGNAVDAAVAVGYALAVTHACCGNIGGGGFMLIHLKDGTEKVIDFRETAPAAATRDMFLDSSGNPLRDMSWTGWKAIGVPGTVAGLDLAETKFGRLGREKTLEPAIGLARDGFILTRGDTDIILAGNRWLNDPTARQIFLRPDGTAWQPGDRLKQLDLAHTLEGIAKLGTKAFYQGPIVDAVVKASQAGGGLLTAEDFAHYQPEMREPLHCSYRGLQVSTVPPASSGGIGLCEMLNVLQGYDLGSYGFHSAQSVHVMTETMRNVFRDRNLLLGDPAFVHNPIDKLLSPSYAAEIRGNIVADKATPSDQLPEGTLAREKLETTHFSVVDKDGNAVAVTYTVNGFFGASVMAPGTGFFLNDEMDDFTAKPGQPNAFGLRQGAANQIAPGKRPLSSMTPTMVSRDGQIFLVLGSPGGSRISTIVLQSLVNVIDYGMKPQEAVDAPRFHHQYQPDKIYAEPYAFSADTAKMLRDMGYSLVEQRQWGATSMIERAPTRGAGASADGVSDAAQSGGLREGWLYGANDARRPAGAAAGY